MNQALLPYASFVIALAAASMVFVYAPLAAALGVAGIIAAMIASTADQNQVLCAVCRSALIVSLLAVVGSAVYLLLLLSIGRIGPLIVP